MVPKESLFNQSVVAVESDIIQRWLTYFEGLLNTENTRKLIESGLATE